MLEAWVLASASPLLLPPNLLIWLLARKLKTKSKALAPCEL